MPLLRLTNFLMTALVVYCQTPDSAVATGPSSYEAYANTIDHTLPAWSADDRDIYFYGQGHSGTAHVYRVAASGGQPARFLKDDQWSASPEWRRDGKRIAFAWQGADGKHIWTSDPQGNDLRQVTRGLFGYDVVPAWSPDGTQIAYTAVSGSKEGIVIANADGGSPQRLAEGVRPRFSPDGKTIAYTAPSGEGLWAVYLKGVKEGEPRLLASSKGPKRGWQSGTDWSPKGRQLVFARPLTGASTGKSDLIFIDVASDTIQRSIRIDGAVLDPAWSHDGKRIAFMLRTSAHAAEIDTLDVRSGKIIRITRQQHGRYGRLVYYRSAGGLSIPAYLFEPLPAKRAKRGRAGLIWLHGDPSGGSFDGDYDASVQYFVDKGFVVLAPNYRGSVGWSPEIAQVHSPEEILADIEAGAQYLIDRVRVDSGRVGVVGFSFGGYLALLSAAKHPALFAAVVDFSGPTDIAVQYRDSSRDRRLMQRLLGGTPDDHPDVYRAVSPISYAGQMESPVLVVHGTADRTVDYKHATAMADAMTAAGKKVRLITLASDHTYTLQDEINAYPQVADFLVEHLERAR